MLDFLRRFQRCNLFSHPISRKKSHFFFLDYSGKLPFCHFSQNLNFFFSNFNGFYIFDEKTLLPQIHELQVIVNKLKVLKIELSEAFQVGAIAAKLPPSWKGYRKRILHKSEDYSLEEIQKHRRIEK